MLVDKGGGGSGVGEILLGELASLLLQLLDAALKVEAMAGAGRGDVGEILFGRFDGGLGLLDLGGLRGDVSGLLLLRRFLGMVQGGLALREPLPKGVAEAGENEDRQGKDEHEGDQAREVLHETADHGPPPRVAGVVEHGPEETAHGERKEEDHGEEPAIGHRPRFAGKDGAEEEEQQEAAAADAEEHPLEQRGNLETLPVAVVVSVFESSHISCSG